MRLTSPLSPADLELPAEVLNDLLQSRSTAANESMLALHVQFGDVSEATLLCSAVCVRGLSIDRFAVVFRGWQMDEETALQELARAADGVHDEMAACALCDADRAVMGRAEIYDSDPAFDADDLHTFSASLDWVQHASPQHAAHGALTPNGNEPGGGAGRGPPTAAPAPAAATSALNATQTEPLSSATATAILPLIQSRVTAQALTTDSVNTAAGYVAPHVQYMLNRAAAQAAAAVPTTPTPAVAMHGMMHPMLVGVEEMNTLYNKISSANAAQNEQRRNNR